MTETARRYGWMGGVVCCALLVIATPGGAQRPSRSAQTTSHSGVDVRAELASVLLSARRYDEAASEYRTLVAADPGNHAFRLGLGRALAWGNRPREAERELLQARDRQNAAVIEPLLRSVRESFDPTAAEAAAWVRESPTYAPYRLALARALAREDPARAVAQFDTLRSGKLVGAMPEQTVLMREQATAYLAIGNRTAASALLRNVLARNPGDTATRHTLAVALFDDRQPDAARAEYDTLIAGAATSPLYIERANVLLSQHNRAAAESDLVASIAAGPTAGAYLTLGGMARDREDLENARTLFDAAWRLPASSQERRDIAAARAALAREERPVAAFAPPVGDDPGWGMLAKSDADNAGVSLTFLGARRSFALSGGFVADAEFGARHIVQQGAARSFASTGASIDGGLSREFEYGPLLVRGAAGGGVVSHPGIADFRRESFTLATWFYAWEAAVDVSHDPAYESLLTTAALSPPDGRTRALTADNMNVLIGGPIGILDVAANWRSARLSDGNVGVTMAGYARVPLDGASPHLFAVYDGAAQSFTSRSTLYWDPLRYVSHAVGLELTSNRRHGWSLAARALPGVAFSRELNRGPDFKIGGPPPARSVRATVMKHSGFQLTSSAEASYRGSWWEAVTGLGYGRARAGGYERVSATVAVRVLR